MSEELGTGEYHSMVPLVPLAVNKETRQSPLGESGMGAGAMLDEKMEREKS